MPSASDQPLETLGVVDESKFFFVHGFPKSGTTWLQMILNAHPQVYCRSEDNFLFLLNQTWRVLEAYNNIVRENDERTAQQGATYYTKNDSLIAAHGFISLCLRKGLAFPGIVRSGAKDTRMTERFDVLVKLFPRSLFIFIVRDPRDVAVSAWFHKLRRPGEFPEKDMDFPDTCLSIANRWQKQTARLLDYIDAGHKTVAFVKYEGLLDSTAQEAARLFQFLSVDDDEAIVQSCLDETTFSKLSDGRDVGEENRDSFFRKGVAGDWKNHINNDVNKRFLDIAGPVMARLGYQ